LVLIDQVFFSRGCYREVLRKSQKHKVVQNAAASVYIASRNHIEAMFAMRKIERI